jgi:hypothetical protein
MMALIGLNEHPYTHIRNSTGNWHNATSSLRLSCSLVVGRCTDTVQRKHSNPTCSSVIICSNNTLA